MQCSNKLYNRTQLGKLNEQKVYREVWGVCKGLWNIWCWIGEDSPLCQNYLCWFGVIMSEHFNHSMFVHLSEKGEGKRVVEWQIKMKIKTVNHGWDHGERERKRADWPRLINWKVIYFFNDLNRSFTNDVAGR